jgi:hypothetical protein
VSERINFADLKVQKNLLHVILDAYSLETVAEHNLPFRDEEIDVEMNDYVDEVAFDDEFAQY